MAKQKAVVTTLKSPVQEDGSRFTLFPETISTAIVHVDKDGNQKTLDEIIHTEIETKPENPGDAKIDDIPFISATEPDHACLWAKIDPSETTVV